MIMGSGARRNREGIAAEDVTVTYRNGHTALFDASFQIPRGTVTARVESLDGKKAQDYPYRPIPHAR